MAGINSINYYEILGVEQDATTEIITQAYRKKALKCHPDKSKEKNATALFQQLTEAYSVLMDPRKRIEYDQTLNQTDLDFNRSHWLYRFRLFVEQATIDEIKDYIRKNEENLYKSYVFQIFSEDNVKKKSLSRVFNLGHFLKILPTECFEELIKLLMKRDPNVLEMEHGHNLHFIIDKFEDDKRKVALLELMGSERIARLLIQGSNWALEPILPDLNSFSPESSTRKVLEKAFSPNLLLRLASFFDIIPALTIFIPIVGWAYLTARIINGARITTQGYAFDASSTERHYTELGIDYNPNGRLTKAYSGRLFEPKPSTSRVQNKLNTEHQSMPDIFDTEESKNNPDVSMRFC